MTNILYIFINILSPIFIQIILGFFIQKKFDLSIKTLTKIQMYILIPGFIFYNIYTSVISNDIMFNIFIFTSVVFFILMLISTIFAKVLKLERPKKKAFINSVILRNQGNFGIPLIALAFASTSNTYALSVHIVVLLTTNILLNTFGLYNASSGAYTAKEAIRNMLRLPILYVIAIALIIKSTGLIVPVPIISTIKILANGLVSVALITLGAQLANTKVNLKDTSIYISNVLRLIISPLITWLFVSIVGYEGVMAQVLIIGSAAPTAVNSVLLAIEFDGDASYASETVLTSTVLSAITVSIVVSLVMTYIK